LLRIIGRVILTVVESITLLAEKRIVTDHWRSGTDSCWVCI